MISKYEILNDLLRYLKESNKNSFGYENDKLISYKEAQILLDYIKKLKKEIKEIKSFIGDTDLINTINAKNNTNKILIKEKKELQQLINEIKEYCEEIESRSIDYTDTDYDLGQDNVARDILRKIRGEDNESN